jgi:hypothetical protein
VAEGAASEWDARVSGGEVVLGAYRNPSPFDGTTVVFTDRAIYSFGEQVLRVPMDGITDYEMPRDKKAVSGVRVRTADGFFFLRVSGPSPPEGNAKDAFLLIGVLGAIINYNNARMRA